MNRPLKFRVWDKHHKQWIGACAIELDGTIIDIHNAIPETNCIAQQYTGLNDKNGKEIFEGDIVKYKTWTGRHDGTTEQHQTQVQFKDGAYYPRYIDDECEDSWYSFKVYDLEVIGNVFETPHLDENE